MIGQAEAEAEAAERPDRPGARPLLGLRRHARELVRSDGDGLVQLVESRGATLGPLAGHVGRVAARGLDRADDRRPDDDGVRAEEDGRLRRLGQIDEAAPAEALHPVRLPHRLHEPFLALGEDADEVSGARGAEASALAVAFLMDAEERAERVAAIRLLGGCGTEENAVPHLRPLLDSDDSTIRIAAINALRGIDSECFNRVVDITMSRLRHKLDDDPKHPRFIKTVWGTGYTFVARECIHEVASH